MGKIKISIRFPETIAGCIVRSRPCLWPRARAPFAWRGNHFLNFTMDELPQHTFQIASEILHALAHCVEVAVCVELEERPDEAGDGEGGA
jgi:hypothetical protein